MRRLFAIVVVLALLWVFAKVTTNGTVRDTFSDAWGFTQDAAHWVGDVWDESKQDRR